MDQSLIDKNLLLGYNVLRKQPLYKGNTMPGITLNPARCVRAFSIHNSCDLCITACPTEAITAEAMVPSVNLSQCVGCGGCAGGCPTEAIALDGFDATERFFALAADEEGLVSCRKNVPCIAVLSVDHLLALASLKPRLTLDMGHCDGCGIATTCRPLIEARAEEANYLLDAMALGERIGLEAVRFAPETEQTGDRRSFFTAINLQNVAKGRAMLEREVETSEDALTRHMPGGADIAQMRKKQIPDKRKLLFTALRRLPTPAVFHVVDAAALTLTSQKRFDAETCTACQMCYRVCPTGALTSDVKNSRIDFDPMLCVRCALCHDVCDPGSLTLGEAYDLREFFEPAVRTLTTFAVRNCDECGVPFASLHGERLCHRCRIEEEEAHALWGLRDPGAS